MICFDCNNIIKGNEKLVVEKLIDNFIQIYFAYFIHEHCLLRNWKRYKMRDYLESQMQAIQLMLPLLNILIKGRVSLNETGASLESYFK